MYIHVYIEHYICLRALQRVVESCGAAFEPHLTSDLLQLVFTALHHTNRFVRETGYNVIAAIVKIPGQLFTCVCNDESH